MSLFPFRWGDAPNGIALAARDQSGAGSNVPASNTVLDRRVAAALRAVPRESFLTARHLAPPGVASRARDPGDHDLDADLAGLMLQALDLRGDERVLQIGTGSGYMAALLSHLAREVHSVEIRPELIERAQRRLSELGRDNVRVAWGDGSEGWPVAAPYQAILVSAAVPEVPSQLLGQLVIGGRLVVPVGSEEAQLIVRLHKRELGFDSEAITSCALSPLDCADPPPSRHPWAAARRKDSQKRG